ncbi:MAG: MFS transporter [Cyclobacteriaceae bacterium]
MTAYTSSKWVLPIIVIAQFCCTSLWFSGNAISPSLISEFGLPENSLGHIASAVQFGFISGTLFYAIFNLADRFSPSLVFMISALLAGCFNLLLTAFDQSFVSILSLRFLTGFFLAGIYPVGMKIASDHYQRLGRALGFLVGALVLGTALPHLIKGSLGSLPWQWVSYITTSLALFGGLILYLLVPNGPYHKPAQKLELGAFFSVFSNSAFRKAAFGYFGHMWELYAFWAFVPVLLAFYQTTHGDLRFDVSIWSFVIIGIGSLGCIAGGLLSEKWGTLRTAKAALIISGVCCLLSPLVIMHGSFIIFILFLLIWGLTVIADSPLFSTLVAQNAPPEIKGTALTIVNCIGFAITIVSIQLITLLMDQIEVSNLFLVLALGPVLGLMILSKEKITTP